MKRKKEKVFITDENNAQVVEALKKAEIEAAEWIKKNNEHYEIDWAELDKPFTI